MIENILVALIAIAVIWFIAAIIRPRPSLRSWHHHFPGMQFAARDLYQRIVDEINRRQIPDLSLFSTKRFEAGIFTPRREYLTIDYKKFSIDVCCISYGTGYYMSWWLRQDEPGLLAQIPVVNDLFGKNPKYQSYYQLDTASLFQSGIHDAILAVIDEITEEKGLRRLTEREREPFGYRY